ncbi:solute carrier family 35 member E1-like isoform X2 [Tachypleus tridentatus]
MPLFVVVLSRFILGEKQSLKVYCSLLPIIIGVSIATVTELSFDYIGLLSALLSTLWFSLQNIYSKKVLFDTGVHHLRLLHILARLALIIFSPFWLMIDLRKILKTTNPLHDSDSFVMCFLLFLNGFLNFIQNVIAFSLLSLVSPLTYSVCNATKRISVITISLLLLRNPVTLFNLFGMLLAILGVLFYNKAKYDANQAKKRVASLPYTKSDSNLLFKYQNSNHVPFIHIPEKTSETRYMGVLLSPHDHQSNHIPKAGPQEI